MTNLRRIALCLAVAALGASPVGLADAKTRHTRSTSKTFVLPDATTRTFSVGFPFALKYANAHYTGKVAIILPRNSPPGRTPSQALVKVLSKGPAVGGSVYRVKVRNSNAQIKLSVRVRITATTTWTA
jgi:hypothetical protein